MELVAGFGAAGAVSTRLTAGFATVSVAVAAAGAASVVRKLVTGTVVTFFGAEIAAVFKGCSATALGVALMAFST